MAVSVIDCGAGNLWSVVRAIEFLGWSARVVSTPSDIGAAPKLVLPGVGAFGAGMEALRADGLDDAIREAALHRRVPILGICLGMQLMGSRGSEGGDQAGLGLIPHRVDAFAAHEVGALKVPHVGFNGVAFQPEGLFAGLESGAVFYFTHSYRMLDEGRLDRVGLCRYGAPFLAAFAHENLCGTQFHPEKSQSNGLMVLRNFLRM